MIFSLSVDGNCSYHHVHWPVAIPKTKTQFFINHLWRFRTSFVWFVFKVRNPLQKNREGLESDLRKIYA